MCIFKTPKEKVKLIFKKYSKKWYVEFSICDRFIIRRHPYYAFEKFYISTKQLQLFSVNIIWGRLDY